MTRHRLWPCLLAVLLPAALGLAAQPAATQPAETRPAAPKAAVPLTVTLIEPGAGPHRPLRFRPKAGSVELVDLTVSIETGQTIGGQVMPQQKMPAMQYAMKIVINDVNEAGDISFDFEYTSTNVVPDPDVDPYVVEMMRSALKAIEGLRGKGVITKQGYNKLVKFERTPDTNEQVLQQMEGMERSMEQLVSPFPAEPVGVGAVWKVKGVIEQQGMAIDQETTFSLVAVEGDRLEIKAELNQGAEPQKLDAPGMPPMSVKSFKAGGTVTSVLWLSRLYPESSRTKLINDTTLLIENMGMEQEMQQHTELTSELKGK
ncbi:MAG: DUF6263 family protein [Planctomycetota bacterium]|jgi:hypothetical protein